jgi:exopolysaccharide production protein ExoZ
MAFIGWAVLILLTAIYSWSFASLEVWGNVRNPEFFFGLGVALVFLRGSNPRSALAGFAGAVSIFAAAAAEAFGRTLPEPIQVAAYGGGSALVILWLLDAERTSRMTAWPTLQYLGTASYSIYLVHLPSITIAAKLAAKAGTGRLPGLMIFAALVAIGVASGIAFYHVVEERLLGVLGKRPFGEAEKLPRHNDRQL